MGEFKPLGSEKLKNDEKIKRILELAYYKPNKDGVKKNSELIKESKNGGVYGIVKEKDGYYVKRGLNEQSLDYIGGLFMKNKNKFSSYAEALKRLELLKGQEELQEATKYVLKQNKPKEEASMPEPSMDAMPPAPGGDVPPPPGGGESMPPPSGDVPPPPGGDESMPPPSGDESTPPMDNQPSDSKRSEYMAEVQKYAGKLGQELRDQKEKMESDDIKYVLNMIISAVDLDKLELDDLEEISKKFDREDEENKASEEKPESDETPSEEPPSEPAPETEEQPSPESDVTEYDYSMKDLEEFINTPMDVNDTYTSDYDEEIDLSKYTSDSEDDVVELDIDEIKNQINRSVGETLSKYFK